jgi:hypothetical protein
MRYVLSLAVLGAAVALAITPLTADAQSTVIDFEDMACSAPAPDPLVASYSFAGYMFSSATSDPTDFAFPCAGSFFYPGSTSLFTNAFGGVTTLARLDGTAFGLEGIKLAYFFPADLPGLDVTFSGVRLDGSLVTQMLTLPSITASSSLELYYYSFTSAFSQVQSVSWTQATAFDADLYQIDDVVVSTATTTPEPSALTLFGMGLLGIIAVMRHRARYRRTLALLE